MARIWRYVLKHDVGRAPCIDGGVLTLCCCKPRIRKSAQNDDWVVGLAPKGVGIGLVSWAGRVSTIQRMGAYGEQHPERSDAIYRLKAIGGDGSEILQFIGGDYHSQPRYQRRDVNGVNALAFSPFWYFGQNAKLLPDHLAFLTYYHVGQTTRGSSPEQVDALRDWLQQWPVGVSGEPRDR